MSLEPGVRLGPYEVTSLLGSGGMGEVYRARDTKLNRDVALKVLPDAFTLDPDRLARFRREAQVLASLNHPNIGSIYGFEEQAATQALVLELVEGPTLADRIQQGPLSLDEALSVAKQIADALEAAHAQGIIHRDLKPANVKLRPDGTVKVLDFGLAKALAPALAGGAASSQARSPTITTPAMTQAGVILGTAAYMAPEQAKCHEADKRSDVWAFGAVLFEMLSGTRAFGGEDLSETLASILKADPDWMLLPDEVPQALRTLIQRCLTKDRRQRVSEIAAAKFIVCELDSLVQSHDPVTLRGAAASRGKSQWLLPAAAAILAAVITGAVMWALRPVPRPPLVTHLSFRLPQEQSFSTFSRQFVVISPDGTRMAYVANRRLFLRSMGEHEPHAIPGAEVKQSLVNPMFAPDGESIAFIDTAPPASLKRIPIGGGLASTIGNVEGFPCGATWSPAGILLAGRPGVVRVSPDGGVPERVVEVSADEEACNPQMLPGGRTVLFTLVEAAEAAGDSDRWDRAQIVAQSLVDGTRRVLVEGGSDARYLPTGHLLYAVAGTMFAALFDPAHLTVSGRGKPVIEGVLRSAPGQPTGASQVAVSETGTLMYLPGPAARATTMFYLLLSDNRGDPIRLKIPPAAYFNPRVSPDGHTLAVGRNEGDRSDIWTYDLSEKRELRRLTFGGNNRYPVWSSDSQRIIFQSAHEGDRAIFWQLADGGIPERLTRPAPGEEHVPESWSRDGRHLLFSAGKGSTFALWVLSIDSRKTEPFGTVKADRPLRASFSPDGRWVAYSLELARNPQSADGGVFLEPFPATGERHQAPRRYRDFHPAWAPDGQSIFYVADITTMVSVPITTRGAVAFGTPVELTRVPPPGLRSTQPRGYDVLPDGRLISVSFDDGGSASSTSEIRVVLNWLEELKRRVPRN